MSSSTTPKVIFITGANTGLGFEILKSLARSQNPYTVLVGSRTPSKGDAAIAQVKKEYPSTASTYTTIQADLSSDSSLESAISTISSRHGHIDVLLNNGGAAYDNDIASGATGIREAYNKTWDTNVSGTHVLTTLAVPLLLKSPDPRLIFMTSGTASLTETEVFDKPHTSRINTAPHAGWPKNDGTYTVTAYRSAKTGLNMLMREWTRILRNDGVKVWSVSPGFLATGLAGVGEEKLRQMGALEPYVGADFAVSVIEGKRDAEAGKVVRRDMIQPW